MSVPVALVVHPDRSQAVRLAHELADWLVENGHRPLMTAYDAAAAGLEGAVEVRDDAARLAELVVSLGGDGTMLRTVHLVGEAPVPILGVNLGQLGYLTAVEPDGAIKAVEAFLEGRGEVEQRLMLAVEPPEGPPLLALNEVVLERSLSGHTVRLDVAIDGSFFTTFEADALIVATPTGSTAYALSARGPIVAPTHELLLLTPVSPHMLFDRTLVLEAGSRIRLQVAGERPAHLVLDGRPAGEVQPGSVVEVGAAEQRARLIRGEGRDFPLLVKRKFRLPDR